MQKEYPFIGMFAEGGDVERLSEYESRRLVAEPKLDGIRFILYINKDGETHLISRNNLDNARKYPFLDKERIPMRLYDSIFDGEMVIQQDYASWANSLSGIQSINGSAVERARRICNEKPGEVRFMIFDVLKIRGNIMVEQSYVQRRRVLLNMVSEEVLPYGVRVTPSSERIQIMYDNVVTDGGEGIMVKDPNAPYVPKRSARWMKIKHIEISEGIIVASTPGDGKNKGLVGSVVVRGEESGKPFQGCFGSMTDVFRREITGEYGIIKKEWIGRRVRVKYYPGGVNALRHCQLVEILDEGGQNGNLSEM